LRIGANQARSRMVIKAERSWLKSESAVRILESPGPKKSPLNHTGFPARVAEQASTPHFGGASMSLVCSHPPVSNPAPKLWVITVIVIVVVSSAHIAQVVGAFADTASVIALMMAARCTAPKYRNHPVQR
jgi:hypothetical protein